MYTRGAGRRGDPGRRSARATSRSQELLETSDIVSIHCALTAETRHLIDAAALGRMKPTAILVNTARGPIVDQAALAVALREGVIGAAGLDVTDPEPIPPDDPLLDLDNCLIVPAHRVGDDRDPRPDGRDGGREPPRRRRRGERLPTPVNPEVYEPGA